MLRVVIDNSAISDERIGTHHDVVRDAVARRVLEVLWTHVTVDELAAIREPDKRARLLCLAASVSHFVPTGAFVVGFSRLGLARLNDDAEAFDEHRRGNIKLTRDALVAATAEAESAAVVTYDRAMRNRAERRGLVVYDWPDALAAADG